MMMHKNIKEQSNLIKGGFFLGRYMIGVEKTPTPCVKKPKTAKTFSQKSAEIFRSVGDDTSISFNDFDVDGCNIYEVILFLRKFALTPNASSLNVAFTKHITNALMKIRDEKLK
jgi:hypothetical protein